MTRLFALAIFSSATLLFMLQPLVGKLLLPVLGGGPAVWSTTIVFFQAELLLGYLYAHALCTRVASRWQRPIHVGVLLVASLTLPLRVAVGEPGPGNPVWWLLAALTSTVGVPFFALSATAPLLQHWFARSDEPTAADPYFLYAASNAGSLLGLLGYLLVEPLATRRAQAAGWSIAFWALAGLVAACAYASRRRTHPQRGRAHAGSSLAAPSTRRALWIVLSLVPSALLLGVTQHLATDVVSAPLLWVIPLALYLATFMAAFSSRSFGSARRWGAAAPLAALAVLVLSLGEVRFPILLVALVHLTSFTVLAMLCHTRLAESRPDPSRLTGYFLCISLGGVLGGIAAGLVAPLIFSSILEYPLAIGAALLLRPQSSAADSTVTSPGLRWARRAGASLLLIAGYLGVATFNDTAAMAQLTTSPLFTWLQGNTGAAEGMIRAALVIPAALLLATPRTALLFAGTAAGLLVGAAATRTGGQVLDRERTFFGVHQVTSIQNGDWHVLTHGTTTHGVQAVRGRVRLLPTAYYHPSGPIGDVVFTLAPDGRLRDLAVVGLGAGALAAYAANGSRIDFFEIDQAVIRIAEDPRFFTYLSDARARPGVDVQVKAVDGRLGLGAMPEASYDLIVVDAFSSDAIPTHLITREAVGLYTARLKPRGVLAFHVSSRFFDLRPVLATIARDQRLVAYGRDDKEVPPERAAEAMRPSVWVILARDEADLGQLARSAPRWVPLVATSGAALWSDDYTNVLGALQK